MKVSTLIIILTITIVGCRKSVVEIEIPGGDNSIVLNGTLCPDSLVKIELFKSRNFQDTNQFLKISDAKVFLFKGDSITEVLAETEKGTYTTSIFKPMEGHRYLIKVDSGLGYMECTDSIPFAVRINKVDTLREKSSLICNIYITDPGEKNHYFLRINKIENNKVTVPVKFLFYNYHKNYQVYNAFFDDYGMNGKEIELKISIPDPGMGKFIFSISTINKAFYQYQQSINTLNENLEGNNWLMENLQLYTNIQGGKGILAAFSNDSFLLDVK